MKKTVIIIGSLALLGVGAFFYFKPKSKGKDLLGDASTGGASTGNGTTGGASTDGTSAGGTNGTSTTTPINPQNDPNTAELVKFIRAELIAKQIFDLRKELPPSCTRNVFDCLPVISTFNALKTKKINLLKKEIADLGYKEQDGKSIKLIAVTTTLFV